MKKAVEEATIKIRASVFHSVTIDDVSERNIGAVFDDYAAVIQDCKASGAQGWRISRSRYAPFDMSVELRGISSLEEEAAHTVENLDDEMLKEEFEASDLSVKKRVGSDIVDESKVVGLSDDNDIIVLNEVPRKKHCRIRQKTEEELVAESVPTTQDSEGNSVGPFVDNYVASDRVQSKSRRRKLGSRKNRFVSSEAVDYAYLG